MQITKPSSRIDSLLRLVGLTSKHHHHSVSLKGNQGRGAAKRRVQFFAVVLISLACVLGVVHLCLPSSEDGGRALRMGSRVRRHAKVLATGAAAAIASTAKKHSSQKQPQRRRTKDYTKPELEEFILSGKLNLIEIRPDYRKLEAAPKDSYDGIIGVFCRLNFDAHKEDPSSGMFFGFCLFLFMSSSLPVFSAANIFYWRIFYFLCVIFNWHKSKIKLLHDNPNMNISFISILCKLIQRYSSNVS